MSSVISNYLSSMSSSHFVGLFAVRSALIDFCTEERASEIIGKVYKLCESVESQGVVKCIQDFELRYSCLDDEVECVDIHLLACKRGESVGVFRLYYRGEQLTPQSLEQEVTTERLPTTENKRRKILGITPERMRRMIANSKHMLSKETERLATTIVDAFMEASTSGDADVTFQLDIFKRFVTMHACVGKEKMFRATLPMAWFNYAQKVETSTVENSDHHDYIFEPQHN